jgi:hypothetical protein
VNVEAGPVTMRPEPVTMRPEPVEGHTAQNTPALTALLTCLWEPAHDSLGRSPKRPSIKAIFFSRRQPLILCSSTYASSM